MTRILPILAVCSMAGCAEVADVGGGGAGGTFDEDAAIVKYLAYGEQFGKQLVQKNLQAAYEMTSSHVQQAMTFDEFVAAYDAAVELYGEPQQVETDINTADPQFLDDEDLGFPASAAVPSRRARVAVMFATEIDEQGYALAGFTCWINVIEEEGQDRVCSFEYAPTD